MITSIANQRMKRLIQLQEKSRARNKEGVFVAEGLKMFEEAPIDRIKEVYIQETLWKQLFEKVSEEQQENRKYADRERHEKIRLKLKQFREKGIVVEQVADDVFKKASDTQTPQGILFVMQQLSYSLDALLKQAAEGRKSNRLPLFLLIEDIQDPGNLGTMLRTAEGAGADGVILSKGTVDIYNPKTIRSTMGSLYRVPFLYTDDLTDAVKRLQQAGITVYAAHLAGEKYFDEIAYEGGSGFLIG
ncbi:MAG: RNA methyltransferase, partial [Lachnospiraceae bacterium]|nr:RNA methyltransferase [Lachnospiraceae bacterium]